MADVAVEPEADSAEVSLFFSEINLLIEEIKNSNEISEEHFDKLRMFMEGLHTLSEHSLLSLQCKLLVQSSLQCLTTLFQNLRHKDSGFAQSQIDTAVIDYEPSLLYSGKSGRPKYSISEDVLLYFRHLGYCWKEIAKMLCISRWTVHRRIVELGIEEVSGYSDISDDELTNIIKNFKDYHGSFVGRSITLGHLRSLGLRIQQRRVTEILRKIDPESSRHRWALLVHRRKYSVPGPNSLWHIDGHHSLIHWKFVIHGGIDGFSRAIVFLHCSTNNRKETVLDLFETSTENWGFPSRVRTDKGGENQMVWGRMALVRGENRGSYLAGSSVHNQRIERLWRDVWTYVCHTFYYTFQAMENQGILDVSNEVHLFVLHHIFLPRINRVIDSFTSGWNNHPLRTEHNWSPNRIWINAMMDRRNRNQHQIAEMFEEDISVTDLEWFGMDWGAPAPFDDGLSTVEVDDVSVPVDDEVLEALHSIDPLNNSSNLGIDIYLRALSLFGYNV